MNAAVGAGMSSLTPARLWCEYRDDPSGIETPRPRLTWMLASAREGERQAGYRILVADDEARLARDEGNLWDSGRRSSRDTIHVEYGGAPLAPRTRCFWKVQVWNQHGEASLWNSKARWLMGRCSADAWDARWIGYDAYEQAHPQPAHDAAPPSLYLPPPPMLRRTFSVGAGLRRATVYCTAQGLYELHMNGARVGRSYFRPGWCEHRKRQYYDMYDVTPLIEVDGANALGAILADGWYAGYMAFRLSNKLDRPRSFYGGEPRFALELELEYSDGRMERVVSDGRWRASYGSILEADLLMGERQDLRRRQPGWSTVSFDDGAWDDVIVDDRPVRAEAYPGVPVKRFEEMPARERHEPTPGAHVYDFGQNLVGWVQLSVSGTVGQDVRVRHAEMLDADRSLYTESLRAARATDSYVLSSDDKVTLEPRFTFHGFRYAEICGVEPPPSPDDVVGVVLHSDIELTGHFECSEPLLNQLFHNIVWGLKGNYFEAPTDCPQRDERLGWTGDAQFFMPTALYVADVGAFYTKWLVDLIEDAQQPDGSFAHVAPDIDFGGGAVGWGDAAFICTELMHRFYGDTTILKRHYPRLVRGMAWLEETSDGYVRSKLGWGDWLNLGGGAKDEVICTAYFAHVAQLMSAMAETLGRVEDSRRFSELHAKIREAFIDRFFLEDGSLLESSQTGYALAFTMGLVPEALRAQASARFREELARFDDHLATGFIGTPRLLPGLAEAGLIDLAYTVLMQTTYPSWLYQVTLGATTMWERWDGWTPDRGFQTPSMNSFNHYAFGSVGEFLFTTIGGIRPAAPGFKHVTIRPTPGGGLTWSNTRYRSIRGEIRSEWRIDGGDLHLRVTVPPNTAGRVHVPARGPSLVRAPESSYVRAVGMEGDAMVFEVGPGTFTFISAGYGG